MESFPLQLEDYPDVVAMTNHYILPEMAASAPGLTGSYRDNTVARYETLVALLQDSYGAIDRERAMWLIDFLNPARGNPYYGTDTAQSVKGHHVLMDNQALEMWSLHGYYNQPWQHVALPAVLNSPAPPAPEPQPEPEPDPGPGDLSVIDEAAFSTPDAIWNDVAAMDALGPRLTGNAAHSTYIDELEAQLVELGAVGVARDVIPIDRWTPLDWTLGMLMEDGSELPVPVASFFPYSGETGPAGVTAGVVDRSVGVPIAVDGKIVLCDAAIPPLTLGAFFALSWYVSAPDPLALASMLAEDYRRSWLSLAMAMPNLTTLAEQGAVGAVVIVDEPFCMADGDYVPFTTAYQGLPAVLVDRDTGLMLRERLVLRPQTEMHLTMHAAMEQANTYHLYGFLPGASEETVILNTHTDGQNAVEENGPAGIMAIGRYFARLPQAERPRTICFSFVTGHFQAQVADSEDFIGRHPEIMAKAVGNITVEHLGCVNWLETTPGVYENMLRPEAAGLFTSNHPALVAKCIEFVQACGLDRVAVMHAPAFGVGAAFINAGIPAAGYLAGPTYLLNLKSGGMDKLDKTRMYQETVMFAGLTGWMLQAPSSELQTLPLP